MKLEIGNLSYLPDSTFIDTERLGLSLCHIIKTFEYQRVALEGIRYNAFKYSPVNFVS